MGNTYTAHQAIEIDIGDACIELCVDLECQVHAGSRQTHDDPGEPASVEILSVGKVWEEIVDVDKTTGKVTRSRKEHGVPAAWFQKLIIEHADQESLLEQAPEEGDDD